MRDKLREIFNEISNELGFDPIVLATIIVMIIVIYDTKYYKKWREIDILTKAHIIIGIVGLILLLIVLIIR